MKQERGDSGAGGYAGGGRCPGPDGELVHAAPAREVPLRPVARRLWELRGTNIVLQGVVGPGEIRDCSAGNAAGPVAPGHLADVDRREKPGGRSVSRHALMLGLCIIETNAGALCELASTPLRPLPDGHTPVRSRNACLAERES